MNNLKSFIIGVFITILCITKSYSQAFDFDFKSYQWGVIPHYNQDTSDKKFSTIYLYYGRITDFEYNEKEQTLYEYFISHNTRLINDEKSIEENNKIYVSVNNYQEIIDIKTRVISSGKSVFEASEKDFIDVENEGRKYKMIALKQVDKGVIIETIIKYRLNMELYGDLYMQTEFPIKKAEFTLITPSYLEFKSKSYNGFSPIIDSTYQNRRFSHAVLNNIEAMNEDEIYSYEAANLMRVEYSYFQNVETKKKYAKWPELGRQFFDRIYKNYQQNEKEIEKLLSKLDLKGMKTDNEKIFAIENYIKSNISIQSEFDEDLNLKEILKRKFCSAYHMNQLVADVFRKSGIPFEIVLTCSKKTKRFDPNFDSWSFLNDVIYFFPTTNLFIDPQEQFLRLGTINSNFIGQYGLFIKTIQIGETVSALASVKLIPSNNPTNSTDIENYQVSVDLTNENCSINYNREMYGYSEEGIKALYYVSNEENRKKFIEDFIKGMATDAKVTKYMVGNTNLTDLTEVNAPLTIQAKITAAHYLEPAGNNKYLFKVGELIGQQTQMYQEKPRQNIVDIPFAHSYHRTITISIPEGYTAKGLDKLILNLEFLNENQQKSYGFISSYTLENNKIIIKCNEYYNDLTYPKTVFNSFKKVINAAADFNKIAILFEKN